MGNGGRAFLDGYAYTLDREAFSVRRWVFMAKSHFVTTHIQAQTGGVHGRQRGQTYFLHLPFAVCICRLNLPFNGFDGLMPAHASRIFRIPRYTYLPPPACLSLSVCIPPRSFCFP